MHQFEKTPTRLRAALAAERFWQAALRLQRTLKRNPYWHLQPRVPAANPDGGQWTESGPLGDEWTIGELVSGVPSLVVRVLARHLVPVLRREAERVPLGWGVCQNTGWMATAFRLKIGSIEKRRGSRRRACAGRATPSSASDPKASFDVFLGLPVQGASGITSLSRGWRGRINSP